MILLIASSKSVISQIDTVFWFAAPWVTVGHAGNTPVVMRLSSFNNATTVRVRQPASTFDTTFVIPANSLVSESLSHLINQIENTPANTVLNRGIKITSNFPITVVYEIVSTGNNPETYSMKGQNGMGLEFVCPFQTKGINWAFSPTAKSQIDVVATQNGTVVWITPRCNVVGHAAGVTYSVGLNVGQSYNIENVTNLANVAGQNLSGTIIVSNKPISVSVTDDSVRGVSGCMDIMGDQIVPVEVVGTEYIINKGGLSAGEFEGAYIVATENFTQITINDGTITNVLLNKGDTYYYGIGQVLTYITGDKPFYVIHASGFGCELGEAIIPPLNCAGSDQVSFTRTNTQTFILNVLCKTASTGNFTLNGNATLVPASAFTVVPGTGGLWSGAQISFTTGQIPVGVTNLLRNTNPTDNLFSMGVINGGATTGCLYHYMSSFLRKVYTNAGIDQNLCSPTNTISLTGSVTGGSTTGIWTTTNGTGTFGNVNSLNTTYTLSANDLNQAQIKFILTSTGNCTPKKDTIALNIFKSPIVDAGSNLTLCKNNVASIPLNGSLQFAAGANWTSSGTGSFGNTGALSTTYIPSISDLAGSSLIIKLTSTGSLNGCPNKYDSLIINLTNPPVVSVSPDASACANNPTVAISGTVTGASTTGIWSGGLGTYNSNNTDLTAIYVPTPAEIATGSVNIVLSSTSNGNCNAVKDSLTITFTSAPGVNAGLDFSICRNNASAVLSGVVGGPTTSGIWSGGTGTFTPNNSTLNSIYVPSAAEIAAGSLTLTLSSTSNGNCNQVTDNVVISITNAPVVNAGLNLSVCKNNINSVLSGVVSGPTTTGIWSGGSGSFNPNTSVLNATYTPSAAELTAGFADLYLSSTNNGNCNIVKDTVRITFTNIPVVNAGSDLFICSNNINSALSGVVSGPTTTGVWSGGLGTYNPGSSALTSTYTPSAAEVLAGVVTLTLTSTNNGNCNQVTDLVQINFTPAPIVDAGLDLSVCKNNPTTSLSGLVTGPTSTGIWTGGTGTFNPNNTNLNPLYTPSAAEIAAGSVTLTLASTSNGNCNQVTDAVVITITNAPIVNAGLNLSICKNNTASVLSGLVTGPTTTGIWSGGSGSYNPSTSDLSATYTPSAAELTAGFADLYLSSTNNGNCNLVRDTVRITFTNAPVVNAGADLFTCANNINTALSGVVSGPTTTGVWTGGLGTYNPGSSALTTTYTPSTAEVLAGIVTLTLTSTNNGNCNQVTDIVQINLTPAPVSNAGLDLSVCKNNPIATLSGLVTGPTSTGIWAGGTGTFNPSSSNLNPLYTPSAAEIAAGSVTLTLGSTGNGNCNQVIDTVVITITNAPVVNAGLNLSICKNNTASVLSGLVTGPTTTGIWSGGSGSFNPSTSVLNATYTPSAAELTAGFADLYLSSTNNGNCNLVRDTVRITFTNAPVVNAGADLFTCANNISTAISGVVSGPTTTGVWSGGLGTYNPGSSALTTTYTPSTSEVLTGVITLTLTSTNNGNCNQVTDVVQINLTPAPSVSAGTDLAVCENNATTSLSGVVSGPTSTGIWTGGTGTYNPNSSTLNALYSPSAAEIAAGSVTLTLGSTSNGNCNQVVDTVVILITSPPIANAGINLSPCANNAVSVLSGLVTGPTTTGIWSGGSGSFNPNTSVLNATYTPSASELAAGFVDLYLTSTNNAGCNQDIDTVKITFTAPPLVLAGNDINTCANNINTVLTGTVSGATTTGIWSGGLGTFNPGNSALTTTYTPSAAEVSAGFVFLTLTSTNNGTCNDESDIVQINLTVAPSVNAGIDLSSCENNPTTVLSGFVSGATTTGVWSGGLGTYNPSSSVLNSVYTPNASEVAAGSVTLLLTSTNNGNCIQVVDSVVINFSNAPTVNAGIDLFSCKNNAASTLSGLVNGPTTTGIWSGGSGTYNPNSSVLNATYTPSSAEMTAGFITLYLTSTNNGNCNQVIDTVLISLTNPPLVNVGADISVCANNPTVAISGSVTLGSTTGVWSSSGSGLFTPSTNSLNATYQLSPADLSQGSVTIKLTSTNNGNCNSEFDSLIVNVTPKPIVDAGINDTICFSNVFYPLNGSVTGSANSGIWSTMGNGVFGNPSNLTTIYTLGQADTLAGQVKLILTSTGGNCLPETDTVLIVIAKAPLVNSGVNQLACDNQLIQLNGTVSSSLTSTGAWTTLGTGSFIPDDSLLTTFYQPSALDLSNGNVTLILSSTNNKGCAAVKDTLDINFIPSPNTNFNTNNVCANNLATFTDNSSTSAGSISSWYWDFGDATTDNTSSPTHMYVNAGTYTVTHVAYGSNGCNDTIRKPIEIYFLPQAMFYQNTPCVGNVTQFNDSTTSLSGSITNWLWNFGDGQTSAFQNPQHAFGSVTNYSVSLVVTSEHGCKDTIQKNVTVIAGPNADFSINPNPAQALETVTFTDLSTGPSSLVNWYWAFGDSAVGNSQNITHVYDNQGVLPVFLVVKDINGCLDSARKDISIILLPDVPTAFTPNGDGQNDLFLVRGGPFKTINIRVYNNWGQLIFETNDQFEGWNGTFNGTEQPLGVFVWVVEVEMFNGEKIKKTGDVTLLR
ncbi:MAG: gliding motility-associated C-terminal domain-containing protein [Bacteroidetes bacterium]|nr:gliding motility-associated C-terminal domain-containing protein [Bacteroidota bacterium]